MLSHGLTNPCTAHLLTSRRRSSTGNRIRPLAGSLGGLAASWTATLSRLAGREQLWIGDGWAARFGMPPEPADFGRSAAHTRRQVRDFHAPVDLLLAYHDAAYERMKTYLKTLTADALARQLDEPQYQPLPTVAVRLVSVLENAMTNQGQISYLKAYHRLGGWFPSEAKDPASFR